MYGEEENKVSGTAYRWIMECMVVNPKGGVDN
jgi:hypothetical protein